MAQSEDVQQVGGIGTWIDKSKNWAENKQLELHHEEHAVFQHAERNRSSSVIHCF